jgi:hypothetical protein
MQTTNTLQLYFTINFKITPHPSSCLHLFVFVCMDALLGFTKAQFLNEIQPQARVEIPILQLYLHHLSRLQTLTLVTRFQVIFSTKRAFVIFHQPIHHAKNKQQTTFRKMQKS